MNIWRGAFMTILPFFLSGCLWALQPRNPRSVISPSASTAQIAACIRNHRCYQYFVVAHRADGLGELENSRAAVKKAIAADIRFIEIDIQKSSDGHLYVYHDLNLGRTSDGKGVLSEKSSKELSRLKLNNGETIPRFEDIYRITRGKAILVLDLYGNVHQPTFKWIAHNGSFDDVIFFTDSPDEVNYIWGQRNRYPNIMMLIDANSYNEVLAFRAHYGSFPEIAQLSFMPTQDQVKTLQEKGLKVYMSLAFEDDVISSLYCLVIPVLKYDLGVDFLESDRPLCSR